MKPIKLHITHRDVFKPDGLPRPYSEPTYCPLATAVRRAFNATNVSVSFSRVSIYDSLEPVRYTVVEDYTITHYNETLSRLQDNPRSYYPITLVPQQ